MTMKLDRGESIVYSTQCNVAVNYLYSEHYSMLVDHHIHAAEEADGESYYSLLYCTNYAQLLSY